MNNNIRFLAGVQNSNFLSNGSVTYGPIDNGQWNNFVAIFNPTLNTINIYINGQVAVSDAVSTSLINCDNIFDLMFGVGNPEGAPSGPEFFNGDIDDIGIWNRALTQEEITTMYNSIEVPTYSDTCNNVSGSLTQGLVGYWPFCGNANDDSGNGNNGTVNGATLTTDRFGNANSAYSLVSQNSNYLEISNSPLLNPISSISLSSWVKLNSYIDNQVFVSKGNTNQSLPYMSYTLKMGDNTSINSKAQFQLSINGIKQVLMTNSTIPLSNWIYITGTYDGNVMKIFVNGVLDNSLSISGSISSFNTNLNFGRWAPGVPNNPQYLNGFIDDIGIWNRALTEQEITNLYNANQCITNITVTDTLIINVGQLSFNDPVTWANNITIAPNPASSQININFNNITNLNGGTLKVINSLGQEVATTPITTSGTNSTMQLATWGGSGMYFVQIINPQGQIVDIKKIILQ